jgi:hypothetical protein
VEATISSSSQTENPSLDDNGDGKVTTLAEGMDAGDGECPHRPLTPAPVTAPVTAPLPRPHRRGAGAQTPAPIVPPAALLL